MKYKITYQNTNSGNGYVVEAYETGEEVTKYFHATPQSARMEFVDSGIKGELWGPVGDLFQKILTT